MKKILFFLAALGAIPCLLLSGCSGSPAETTTTSTTTGSISGTSRSESHTSVATTTSTETETVSTTNTTGSKSSTSVMTTTSTSTIVAETTTVKQEVPAPQDALSILVIGDSNTEIGFIANSLQYLINDDYQQEEYGYYPFYDGFRANYDIGAVKIKLSTDWNREDMTTVQGNTVWSGSGLAATTSTAGQTAKVTFAGTQIKLFYATQAGGGSMVCTIDGKQETTIHTDGTPETKVEIFSGLDPAATHMLEIRVVEGPVILCGVDVTAKTGRGAVHNWGNSGATTTHFTMIDQSVFKTGVALLDPDVVVVLLGTNDTIPAKEFTANQTAILNAVKEAAPTAKRLLVSTFDTGYHPLQMKRYLAQSYPTAAENTGSSYWNMHDWFGDYDESRMLDMLHCNQAGGSQIAVELYEQIKQVLNQ